MAEVIGVGGKLAKAAVRRIKNQPYPSPFVSSPLTAVAESLEQTVRAGRSACCHHASIRDNSSVCRYCAVVGPESADDSSSLPSQANTAGESGVTVVTGFD
jgi:hypothetical protein